MPGSKLSNVHHPTHTEIELVMRTASNQGTDQVCAKQYTVYSDAVSAACILGKGGKVAVPLLVPSSAATLAAFGAPCQPHPLQLIMACRCRCCVSPPTRVCNTGRSALPAQPSRDAATSPRAAGLPGPDERSFHMGRRSSPERPDPCIWPCHLGLFPSSPWEWGLCVIAQPGAAGTAGGRVGPRPQVQPFPKAGPQTGRLWQSLPLYALQRLKSLFHTWHQVVAVHGC